MPRGAGLIDGAIATRDRLRDSGYAQAILSNHVPELPDLVGSLGIGDRFDAVITSAATGWEKPHPRMFELGRAALGDPAEIWMVGDNPDADIAGAEAAGMHALLVQNPGRPAVPGARRLVEVADTILLTDGRNAPRDR